MGVLPLKSKRRVERETPVRGPSVFGCPRLASKNVRMDLSSLRLCAVKPRRYSGLHLFRPGLRQVEPVAYPGKAFSDAMEQPLSPRRNARQQEKPNQYE